MRKQLKTVKATLIVGILFLAMVISIAPTASSQSLGIFTMSPYLTIEIVDAEAVSGIVPADPIGKTVQINVKHQIQGLLSSRAAEAYQNRGINAQVAVSIGEVPEYCNVFLQTYDVSVPISNELVDGDQYIQFRVTFSENAPLNAAVDIPLILKTTVPPAIPWRVEPMEQLVKTVTVSAAYVPIINAVPKQTFKEITPGDIAVFDIELENQGNALTEFRFDLVEVPEGWTASIISQAKISSTAIGGNSKETVQLQVRPPHQFGWHDEDKQVTVDIWGFYYADPSQGQDNTSTARPIPIRVIVRNRGFSFQPGIEMAIIIIVIIALIVLALFAKMYYFKK